MKEDDQRPKRQGNRPRRFKSEFTRMVMDAVTLQAATGDPHVYQNTLDKLAELTQIPASDRTDEQRQQIEWCKALLNHKADTPAQG